jgi:dimethylglycine dehydrogenase
VVPAIGDTGLKTVLNGPTCWPADGNHLVGPSFEKKNYWLACAESYGIAHSGGLGKYVAEWIVNGEPAYELNETDPCRYGYWAHQDFVADKVTETYGWNNHVHFPNENGPTARPVSHPAVDSIKPIYDLLKARGCQFGFSNGWEAPNYFTPGDLVQRGNEYGSYRRPRYEPEVK